MTKNNITCDSLELLYLYVENIRCFKSQKFKFTTEYKIEYDKNKQNLTIEEIHENDRLKGFFGPNISNINVIVGKNGSGKSTILELLGLNPNELDEKFNIFVNTQIIWFEIYKTNLENIFLIRGYNNLFIKTKSKSSRLYKILYHSKKNMFVDAQHYTNDNQIFYYRQYDTNNISKIFSKINSSNRILGNKRYIESINNAQIYELIVKHTFFKNILNTDSLSYEIEFVQIGHHWMNDLDFTILLKKLNLFQQLEIKLKCIIIEHLLNTNYGFDTQFYTLHIERIESNIYKHINSLLNKTLLDIVPKTNQEHEIKHFNEILNKFILNLKQLHEKRILEILNENKLFYSAKVYVDMNQRDLCYDDSVSSFLHLLDELETKIKKLSNKKINLYSRSFEKNLSEGELKLVKIFGAIYNALKLSNNKNNLIILDEPDLALHPNWSHSFIYNLIKLIDNFTNNNPHKSKYQIIISTHSPFMLSDIPKEYITTIDIKTDKETGDHVREVSKSKKSFASNYYDLLNNSFFLDSTLGHYARKKIEEILEIINKTMTSKPIKQESNQTFINIMSAYDYDFLDIIKMTKTNNHSDISDTIVQKYSNLFSNKKIDDIITIVENNKEKSVQEILNILKRDNIYLSIDYDYIYKKLYKIIEIIDEPFIKESLKQELDKNYKNIADTNYIDYIDSKIALLEQELHNLKKLREENKGELNDKT